MNTKIDQEKRISDLESKQTTVAILRQHTTVNIPGVTNTFVLRGMNRLEDPFGLGVTIDAGGFILPKGRYIIEARSLFYRTNHNRLFLFDVTNGNTNLNPESEMYYNNTSSDTDIGHATATVILDIEQDTKYELRHYTQTGFSNGLSGSVSQGVPAGLSVGSTVATIAITKIG